MLRLIFAGMLSAVSLFGWGQEATVSGRVVTTDNHPLAAAAVSVITQEDDTLVGGAVTDSEGRFVLPNLVPNTYKIVVDHTAYQSEQIPLLVSRRNSIYDLGDILLRESEEEIDEILVVGSQTNAEASIDRRVFDMSQNFAQSSGSLLDAMKSLPGITVEQDGKVLLRGSDRVVILIDGQQSALAGYGNQAGLDNIPAANIATIEIINNPSARYDAAGMAGIINITYHKEKQAGWSGTVGMTLSVGALSKREQDLPTELGSFDHNFKYGPSLGLNYNTDSLNYFLQAEVLSQDDLPNNEFTTRYYDDGRVIASQVPENREQIHYIVKTGADWDLKSDNALSVSAIYDYESHEDNAEVPFIDQNTQTRNRFWFWTEEEITGFANLTIEHTYAFAEPGHELKSSIQYTRGWEDESYFLNEDSPVRIGTDATHLDAKEYTVPLQIDYIKPLATGRVETGFKYQKRWIPVTYDVEPGVGSVIYTGLGDWSEWNEEIYAIYGNYLYEDEQIAIESGLRLEQTDVSYEFSPLNIYYSENDAYDYFKLYPNVRVTYKLSDEQALAVYFNRRVDRPGEPELRIFAKYDDPELLKVGNPYLRPQFTKSYELAYERFWDSGSVTGSIYFRDIDDYFTRIYNIDSTNPNYDIINKIYQNTGHAEHHGVEVLFAQDVSTAWRLTGSVNWFENRIDAYSALLLFPFQRQFTLAASEDDTWDFKINNLVYLPWDLEAQLSYVYYAERNVPQGQQLSRSSVDIGLKKPFATGQGEVVFAVSDIFNKFHIRQNIDGQMFTARYENLYETQVVSLGVNYRF